MFAIIFLAIGIGMIIFGVKNWKKVNALPGTDAANIHAKLGMKWGLILLIGFGSIFTFFGGIAFIGSILGIFF